MLTLLFITSRGLYPMAGPLGTYDLLADSLVAQVDAGGKRFDDYEVVIVDKENPFPRPEVNYAARHSVGGVHYLRPRPTPWTQMNTFAPNAARNTGLIHACGDTIVGMDDCFMFSPRYLACIATLASAGTYTAAVLRQADGSVAYPPQTPGPFPADKYGGGLTSYPLAAALAVNGWDERFDGGSGGDIDFFDRTRRWGVAYVRDALVVATGFGHGPRTAPHPRCWRLVWDISLARRATTLRGNDPWSQADLERWRTCGRDRGMCKLTRGRCDYPYPELPMMAGVRERLEVEPWFDLTSARATIGVDCGGTGNPREE